MSDNLLTHYAAIEQTSLSMLSAAERQDWHEVARLEKWCSQQITALRNETAGKPLSAAVRTEKQRILQSILRHDARIRALAEPWVEWNESVIFS